ncbi:metallophosphoesterase [Irregularibacter muris]|uniref:Metallophosphoesterase n=1 Tax=Irregularibacter muris TaxID=1796619 RepID=A0AAE3HE07_9FIRM|nr:metallophosphoesterase [Irregularibacter muris]MCR1897725.1 metallophosphoesterase [Irregularibacter muris]
MYGLKDLTKVFQTVKEITFDDHSKIVFMSDCHRGDGSWGDNFSKNQNFFFAALTHYYNEGYTYIEIGDGDELWENKRFSDILEMHKDAFWILSKFYQKGRLYFIYGNHDIVKKDEKFVKKNLSKYFDERKNKVAVLFDNIEIHEGLVLRHKKTNNKIFLVHGHQVDFLNSKLWRASRFLVRYLWRPLETYGIKNPASPAKNYEKRGSIDKALMEWVKRERHMLIAGHTHKPIFPEVGQLPYFNDGSCVHPRCITAIEIERGYIKLVKWSMKTREDGSLFIGREILAGPEKVNDYFSSKETAQEDLALI